MFYEEKQNNKRKTRNNDAVPIAEMHRLAHHVANHHMEAKFESLRHEVSSELGNLRTAMSQSSNQGVYNTHTSSDIQKDAAIFRLTQELYHRCVCGYDRTSKDHWRTGEEKLTLTFTNTY